MEVTLLSGKYPTEDVKEILEKLIEMKKALISKVEPADQAVNVMQHNNIDSLEVELSKINRLPNVEEFNCLGVNTKIVFEFCPCYSNA
ncbi:MAG: hypothetical protein H6550_02605 [Chitinophagales bacterium]|nr:hypothetical protein [Chitinophagales bacterium]